MALINCPECDQQVSEKAKACPNCGFPIEEMSKSEETALFPELPADLTIGVPIKWIDGTLFFGVYNKEENNLEKIPPGTVRVQLHIDGISIGNVQPTPYNIHISQIINLKQISRTELGALNKNLIGRAVVGALIYGPVGAAIGVLTANEEHNLYYLIINYWDVDSKNAQSLIINADRRVIDLFIKNYEDEVFSSTKKKCPYCAQITTKDAMVCEHCGKELPVYAPSFGEIQINKTEFSKLTYRQKFSVTEYQYLLSPNDAEIVGKMLGNFQSKDIPKFCEKKGRKVSSFEQ